MEEDTINSHGLLITRNCFEYTQPTEFHNSPLVLFNKMIYASMHKNRVIPELIATHSCIAFTCFHLKTKPMGSVECDQEQLTGQKLPAGQNLRNSQKRIQFHC